jgi:uncharacterized repeat protein (TIGR01451 family)
LVIDRKGNTTHYGDALLHDDLIIKPFDEAETETDPCAAWETESGEEIKTPLPGIEFETLKAVPEKAAPWQIYQAELKSKENENLESPIHQLRLEIANPGDKGDPSRYLLGIGSYQNGAFEPCLSVGADCTVTVNSTLRVEGQIIEGPIQADPDDPEFRDAVEGRWMYGLGETDGKVVDAFLGSTLQVSLSVGVTTSLVNEMIEYSVTVTNIGQNALTDITLTEALSLDGELIQDSTLAGTSELEPQETFVFEDRSYTPDQVGSLTINATVMGVGPVANPVSGTDSATIQIYDTTPPV